MKPLTKAILIGLGLYKLIDLVKFWVPWTLQPVTKQALIAVGAGGLAAWGSESLQEGFLVALGAAGVSGLAHELQDALSAMGDDAKTNVIVRSSGRSPNPPRRM